MELLSATKVSQMLDVSVLTLTRWYQWQQENPDYEEAPKLPKYIQVGVRAPRYWQREDISQLKVFQNWVKPGCKGVMGSVTQKYVKSEK